MRQLLLQERQHTLRLFRFAIHVLLQIVVGDVLQHRLGILRIFARQRKGHDAAVLATRRHVQVFTQIVHRF